jgi:hypothetical protein
LWRSRKTARLWRAKRSRRSARTRKAFAIMLALSNATRRSPLSSVTASCPRAILVPRAHACLPKVANQISLYDHAIDCDACS